MAQLAFQQIGDGNDITFAGVGGSGDTVPYDERGFLEFKNTNAASRTVTIAIPGTVHGTAVPDLAVVVAANTGIEKIKLTPDMVDLSSGLISITYSATADLTVAAQRV
jgi:hypothetical protein